MACRAFLSASENARRGVNQKLAFFKGRIKKLFDRIQFETTGSSTKYVGTGSALFERYKKIKKECIVFEGCKQRVKQARLTGNPTDEQILHASTALYNKRANIRVMYKTLNGDPVYCGKTFVIISAYKYMRSINLWSHVMAATDRSSRTN